MLVFRRREAIEEIRNFLVDARGIIKKVRRCKKQTNKKPSNYAKFVLMGFAEAQMTFYCYIVMSIS